MNEFQKQILFLVEETYSKGIKSCIVEESDSAYLFDPVFQIKRNRVIAETVKALLRINREPNQGLIQKLLKYLISTQHPDGSWNEIHAHYNQPSALVTAIVADAFLLAIEKKIDNDFYYEVVSKAKTFVLSKEQKPGFYLKSTKFTADHLNVDATCAAFLAHYARVFDDEQSLKASRRASDHIIKHQWRNGVYPYAVTKGSYTFVKQVPCIHYQGITLYYLSKIYDVTCDEQLKKSMLSAGSWLASTQQQNGRFDWSQSGLMFTYYVTGAYAFALFSFHYLSQFELRFKKNMEEIFPLLQSHQASLFLRWEKANWLSLLGSIIDSIETAKQAQVTLHQKVFRLGYGLYRQFARKRYSERIDETMFHIMVNVLNLHVSTIEPFSNYPDLFMTTEIIDCLSAMIEK